MPRSIIETLVGAIVLALCVLFVMVVYKSGTVHDEKGGTYLLKAAFERADGVDIGTDVSISGVRVGRVISKELDQDTYSAIVSMHISKQIKLPVDTSAEVTSTSFLGDKYLALVPGADPDMLGNGDIIEFTQSSISIEGLIGKLIFGLESKQNDTEQTGISEPSEVEVPETDSSLSKDNTNNSVKS